MYGGDLIPKRQALRGRKVSQFLCIFDKPLKFSLLQNFPYIIVKFNELQNFSLIKLLSFTVSKAIINILLVFVPIFCKTEVGGR